MDVPQLIDTDGTYFCAKCQSFIWISIQSIHSAFCLGILPEESLKTYSDEQVYELSQMMQDHPLLLDAMLGYAPRTESETNVEYETEPSIRSSAQKRQLSNSSGISRINRMESGVARKNKEQTPSGFSPLKPQQSSAIKNQQELNLMTGVTEDSYQCANCFDYVRYDEYFSHQNDCRDKGIKCRFCYMHFPYNLIQQHQRFCEMQTNEERMNERCTIWGKESSLTSSPPQSKKKPRDTTDDEEESKIDRNIYYHRSDHTLEENQYRFDTFNETEEREQSETQSMVLRKTSQYSHERQMSERAGTKCDWSNVTPEVFIHALDIIFPPFGGQQSEFKRQQADTFRQNLMVRLINIARQNGPTEAATRNNDASNANDRYGFGRVKYASKNQKEYKTCSICMCDFEDGEDLYILPCLHRFHVECISKWVEAKQNCPICKRDMTDYL